MKSLWFENIFSPIFIYKARQRTVGYSSLIYFKVKINEKTIICSKFAWLMVGNVILKQDMKILDFIRFQRSLFYDQNIVSNFN